MQVVHLLKKNIPDVRGRFWDGSCRRAEIGKAGFVFKIDEVLSEIGSARKWNHLLRNWFLAMMVEPNVIGSGSGFRSLLLVLQNSTCSYIPNYWRQVFTIRSVCLFDHPWCQDLAKFIGIDFKIWNWDPSFVELDAVSRVSEELELRPSPFFVIYPSLTAGYRSRKTWF